MKIIQEKLILLFVSFMAVLVVFWIQGAMAQDEGQGLTLQIEAQKEVNTLKGEEWVTIRVPAEVTNPGDILVYTITYLNAGKTAVQNASVVDPVPEGTTYVLGSASGEGADILCSIDKGFSYHSPPVRYMVTRADGSVEEITAPADMYTHIKWVIGKGIEPGMSGRLSFKVKVN